MSTTNLISYQTDQRKRTLAASIWISLIAAFALGLLDIQFRTWKSVAALFAMVIICLPLLILNAKGYFKLAALLYCIIVLIVININMYDGDGIRDSGILAYPIFIMLGTLFFGKRASPIFALAALGSLIATVYLEIHGYVHPTIGKTEYSILLPIDILLLIATAAVWVIARNIEKDLEHIKTSDAELQETYTLTLEAWAKVLEYRDRDTEGHSRRLVVISTRLARALGLSEREVSDLQRGALLHDIGKLAIPDQILLKPAALDPNEREIIQKHTFFARQMLANIPFLQPAITVAYSHHEQWDGKGYPDGLKGEAIPLLARVFAIVDNWDALSSERPYRHAWSNEQVNAYIKENSGTKFDPHLVDVFLQISSNPVDRV